MRGDRLYKRGEVWWCRVRNRAGRIVRRSTKCHDYQAALGVAAEYERTAASADHSTAEKTTLERCVNDYLADLVRRGRAAATLAIAQQKTGHALRLWGARMPMARVTASLVTEYIDARLKEGASRVTVKKELGHIGQVLRIARYHGRFHLEVVQIIPPYFSGEHRPRERWLTLAELRALLEELPKRRAAHMAWIVATGGRLSESYAARRGHVDLTRRVVAIQGTKTEGAAAEIPITAVTERLLGWALANAPGKDVLFHPWGKIHRDLAAACVRAGIARVSPNDLRRTFGHWHRNAGVPVDVVAMMLRHATDKLAQTTYAKLAGGDLSDLVNRTLNQAPATVLAVYREGASDDPKALALRDESQGKSSAPDTIRTYDLRFRKPTDERRSRGTKLGLLRASAARGVPELYTVVFGGNSPYRVSPKRTFRLVGTTLERVS